MGPQPKYKPLDPHPNSEDTLEIPSNNEVYKVGLTYLLHLTTSKGQTAVWVRPQAKSPPNIHLI